MLWHRALRLQAHVRFCGCVLTLWLSFAQGGSLGKGKGPIGVIGPMRSRRLTARKNARDWSCDVRLHADQDDSCSLLCTPRRSLGTARSTSGGLGRARRRGRRLESSMRMRQCLAQSHAARDCLAGSRPRPSVIRRQLTAHRPGWRWHPHSDWWNCRAPAAPPAGLRARSTFRAALW